MTIDKLSFSRPSPSLVESTVPMIENPQLGVINVGVGLFPPLMGTFDYLPPSENVKMISVVPDQPKAKIFLASSFRTTYFNDLWALPSPSTMMEGTGHHGISIPFSMAEFAYSIVQEASADPDLTPASELDPVIEPTWARGSFVTIDSLDLVLPSDEVILEALNSLYKP
jgi:hypothetical protein